MFDYAPITADAAAAIQEFGAMMRLTFTNDDTTVVTREARMLFLEKESGNAASYGDSGIKVGDWKFLAEASAQPINGMLLVSIAPADSTRLSIIFTDIIGPALQPVAYWVWARQA